MYMYMYVLLTKEAGLTDILELSTGLAHFRSLVSHPSPRAPPEHGKWTSTDLHGHGRLCASTNVHVHVHTGMHIYYS